MTQLAAPQRPAPAAKLTEASDIPAHDLDGPAVHVPAKPGRPMDASRDADILDAALDILAEEGYEGMTIDMVAARAKAGKATLYRRWPSKTELVIDAVACMKTSDIDYNNLPDTGTLRGDLIAMMKTPTIKDAEKKLKIMAGLVTLLARNPQIADLARNVIVMPRVELNRFFMKRARDRGEIPADADIDTVSLVSVSMVSYKTLMMQEAVQREFLMNVLDSVVLPALGIAAAER
jgi:AcrR family transcriptional regulator